jgi:hypothetical protein
MSADGTEARYAEIERLLKSRPKEVEDGRAWDVYLYSIRHIPDLYDDEVGNQCSLLHSTLHLGQWKVNFHSRSNGVRIVAKCWLGNANASSTAVRRCRLFGVTAVAPGADSNRACRRRNHVSSAGAPMLNALKRT